MWEQLDSHQKKINLDRDLTAFTKINSKWVWDLNIKHLKVSIGENWDDLGYSNDFLATPKTSSVKETSDKLDFTKIKNFCSGQDKFSA